MKKLIALLLAAAMMFSLASAVIAEKALVKESSAENIRYALENDILTVAPIDPLLPSIAAAVPSEIEIDGIREIRFLPGVTEISANAFADFTALEHVVMAKSVKRIGSRAFSVPDGAEVPALTLALPKAAALDDQIFDGRKAVSVNTGSAAQYGALTDFDVSYKNSFNILLIGNSYSEDASNFGFGMNTSRLRDMLQNAYPDREISVGLLFSSGKTLAWHYDKARRGIAAQTLYVIDEEHELWYTAQGAVTVADAMNWVDWDAVLLQPYAAETIDGVGGSSEGFSYELEESLGYLLHAAGVYAPSAKPYLFAHWAGGSEAVLNAEERMFLKTVPILMETTYTGKVREEMGAGAYRETGETFAGVIPCGTAIQNARNTYLGRILYHADATPATTANDPVVGLLRDGGHVSFNQGRYLLALTVAMVVTQKDADTLCKDVPVCYSGTPIGTLPADYLKIIQTSAKNAVDKPKTVTDASTDDDVDPAARAAALLEGAEIHLSVSTADESGLETALRKALDQKLTDLRRNWPEITVAETAITMEKNDYSAEVTLQFGYTTTTANLSGTFNNSTAIGDGGAAGVRDTGTADATDTTDTTDKPETDESANEIIYSDVAKDAWYSDSVAFVTGNGMMNGTGEATFSPNATMTRAMLMTVFARCAGENTDGGATWYEKGVAWAKAQGISDGLNPNESVTREQLVTMLYRYAGSPNASGELYFTDATDISNYAQAALRWAVANGIITGVSKTTFAPQDTATRAQVATVLMRFLS